MALFSWSMQVIKRSAGRSSVAAAAYRAGERLWDERRKLAVDYSHREDVEHTEILLPANAPAWCRTMGREELWNAVEASEKRKDAQVARDLRIMIPRELDPADRIQVVHDYLVKSFVSKGMIADVAWHNKTASDGRDQPHAHCLLTMRPLGPNGFGPKSRHDWVPDPAGRKHANGRPVMIESNADSWNSVVYFENCRADWENIANAALARAGSDQRIDRRSLLARGLVRLPEPALRLAYYLNDLRGVLKERFGQFQMARHYQSVEKAANSAFKKMDHSPAGAGAAAQVADRFFDWFERQLARLEPASRDQTPNPSRDMER